ncbi:unnamed protein product [Echinostoma caproni]|uniref:Claudin n=1 Tax=Echinostoma caproni TaxID=27848 RepID=A0A183BFD0_9TREM|nr:unnamed protein product [Echinostoma caproni]
MTRRVLEPMLLGVAITCIILSVALDDWNCGSLFKSCLDRWRTITLGVIILFCLGLACLVLVFLMDLAHCCSTTLDLNASFTTTRLCALFLGLILLTTGLIVYTAEMGRQWSYLSGVSGVVFAVQGSILAFVTCQCTSARGRTRMQVTRTIAT